MAVIPFSCVTTSSSDIYNNLLSQASDPVNIGRIKFQFGDMGGIYPHTLKSNAFVYKIATLALLSQDSTHSKESIYSKYGFIYPDTFWDWDSIPIENGKPAGLVFGKISGKHPVKGKFWFETAALGCGTCHGGVRYGRNGKPTKEFVLGMPNTSINLEAFGNDLFKGYNLITRWEEEKFLNMMVKLFPQIQEEELGGLRLVFKNMKGEVRKILATRRHASPYKIGGPGTMNGIASVKRGLGMLDNSKFHSDELSFVSIPALVDKSYRSSLLVSGNYAPRQRDFFYEITSNDTSSQHDHELANIVSLFTIGTMGYNAKMAAASVPHVQDVMKFLAKCEVPAFPGDIDPLKSELGRALFEKYCQTCHGRYEGTPWKNKLFSFPNRLVPLPYIRTDSIRAVAITKEDLKMLNKIELGKYFNGKANRGYVAPILTGIWATAPYFHNGSVPTLWHLMHPQNRPERFYVGGHPLDYEKIGILGEQVNGIYQYPPDYKPWSDYEIFDTHNQGLNNTGHLEPFHLLTEAEKENLLEFLKTL